MTTQFAVKVDEEAISEAVALYKFIGGNTSLAIQRAINKALPITKTAAAKEITSQARLTAAYVKGKLTVVKANKFKLEGRIKADSRGLLWSKYSTDTKVSNDKTSWLLPPPVPVRGIKVKVKPAGPIKQLSKDYFYMVLPSSRALAIVKRRDTPGAEGGTIEVEHGPSVSQIFNDVKNKWRPSFDSKASDLYTDKLINSMKYIVNQQYPPE